MATRPRSEDSSNLLLRVWAWTNRIVAAWEFVTGAESGLTPNHFVRFTVSQLSR